MSNPLHEAAGRDLQLTWEVGLDYLADGRFVQIATERTSHTSAARTGRPNG